MMKKIYFVAILMLFAISISAQTVEQLTPQQRLEKAKRDAAEAKQAIKEAKLAAKQQEKESKLKEKENAKAAKMEQKIAKMEAEAARLKAQAEEERAKLNVQQPQAKPEPVTPKVAEKPQVKVEEPKKEVEQPKIQTEQPKKEVEKEPQGWTVPTVTESKTAATQPATAQYQSPSTNYLQGAVPEIDGKVVFTLDLDAPGKSADEIYNTAYQYLEKLSLDSHQRKDEGSAIALVNRNEGKIVARLNEWIVFASSALSLDRTKFNYVAMATCTDGKLHFTIERISYQYEENRSTGFRMTAEELISDKAALNKKGEINKAYRKFRVHTIDRVNEIFDELSAQINR